jgi:hypothetical protein
LKVAIGYRIHLGVARRRSAVTWQCLSLNFACGWRADVRSAGVSDRVITDRRLSLPRNSRIVQRRLAAADAERLCIGRDASGGSAFGILRQSIAERQPCLPAGSPDVFSGLEIFWYIQAAARQADDTGARPFGEQRSPADCAEASNKNRGRVATSQRTGHCDSIQGHKHSGIERRAKRPLTHPAVADAHIDRLAMCHISRSATEAPAADNLQLALLALVRTSIRQPMVRCPPNRAGAYLMKCAARLSH